MYVCMYVCVHASCMNVCLNASFMQSITVRTSLMRGEDTSIKRQQSTRIETAPKPTILPSGFLSSALPLRFYVQHLERLIEGRHC